MLGGLGEHAWFEIYASRFGDMRSQRNGELACAAAQVQ